MPRKKSFKTRLNRLLRKLQRFEVILADIITQFSGSMIFVYFHTVWFILWFIFLPHQIELLTLIVSLEAIYLSTFILVSQNRERELAEARYEEEDKDEEEMGEDLEEIQADVEGIEKDVDDIAEDVQGIEQDVDDIAEDVEGIEKDIEEIHEDVDAVHTDIADIKKMIMRIEERLSQNESQNQK